MTRRSQAVKSALTAATCVALTALPSALRAADTAATPAAAARTAPEAVVDTEKVTAVQTYAAKVPALIADGYPKIVALLGCEKSPVPPKVNVILDMQMDGVAGTDGSGIHVSARYVAGHPNDYGMIIHELTHVAQSYPRYDPVWLVEGVADWVRWFNFEPVSKRPHPNPDRAHYNDSYQTTASFLDYVVRTYDKDLIHKLDAALKTTTYSPEIFEKATGGKTLDQLNAEWIASLRAAKTASAAK